MYRASHLSKDMQCGHKVESSFPSHVAAKVQYGANVESLMAICTAGSILRPVIDTTIKSRQNVLNALSLIAKLGAE